ncbi:hypothetical protein [Streptomyces tsukubensis]|uniref:DUF732 domain-containing protein n=1 Tax=Streptomyces tsukubensis TaxID=83656 RepID=A0A1V4A297_9ACTN|nr:hypothetical protein [Streptomyces tsukubensis]OON73475.1 hypothetical protein B1H18_27225 [Streptomyces tsukubensis]QFR96733.1 hypothetical protein GBW32_31480 [Streptomyces tsukubensis]
MRPFHRRPAAAAAVLTAALVALTACGSDGDGKSGADSAAGSPSASAGGDPAKKKAESAASAAPKPTGPVLSDSSIKPATGSFTKKQKQYLSGRVPESMDPAAVLQSGQEACDRIKLTASQDKDAVVGALIAGEIPDAVQAVEQLCPTYRPLLARARAGFSDGTRSDPAAGTYRALTDAPDNCVWKAVDSDGKVLASSPQGGSKATEINAKVPSGAKKFISTGCYAWVLG